MLIKKSFRFFVILIFFSIISHFISCKDDIIITEFPPIGFFLKDVEPSWSPDGRTVVYIHYDTSSPPAGMYLIDTNGTNKRLFLNNPYANNPDWSPDGNWIVFGAGGQIYKIKTTGDSLTQLTFVGNNFFPSWSNDGEWIAYDSNENSPNGMNFIWKMRKDGSQKIRIAYDTANGEIRMPDWSSNKIVHIRYFVGVFSSEICIMDENGSNFLRITYNSDTDYGPKLSTDGQEIVFYKVLVGPKFQVFKISVNDSNLRQLTTKQGYTPSWSPDGESIVYSDPSPNNGRLWIMRKDGSQKRQLTF